MQVCLIHEGLEGLLTSKEGRSVLEPLKFLVTGLDGQDPYHLAAKLRLHAGWFLVRMVYKFFVALFPLLWNTQSMKIVLIHTFSKKSTLGTTLVPYI